MAGPQLADARDDQQAVNDKGQTELRLLAHSLIGFAAQQDLRLDTFALGPASRALGKVMTCGASVNTVKANLKVVCAELFCTCTAFVSFADPDARVSASVQHPVFAVSHRVQAGCACT